MLWSELRDEVRADLADAASTKKWSDEELLSYARDGMRDISKAMPMPRFFTVSPTAGQRSFDLPDDRVGKVTLVEHPSGYFMEEINWVPGTQRYFPVSVPYLIRGTAQVGNGWYRVGNVLWLTKDPVEGEDLTVSYEGQRELPAADDDAIDLLDNDLELLKVFVLWKAFLRVAGQDATLSRWKEEGRRDDNPVIPAWGAHKARYVELLTQRANQRSYHRLYRRGRL